MSKPSEVVHGFGVFPHRGLTLTGGRGSWVETEDGQRLLDAGGASYGTGNVGHAHPRVVQALQGGATGLTHASQVFAHPARSALVDRLRELAGPWAGRVFLSNSGTEAVECAIKTALVHTGRNRLVAFEQGFHGRTLGALSATHKPRYRAPFHARMGETTFVPYGDAEALAGALGDDVAAVLVEPVQGEGGVRVPPEGFLPAVQRACREAGALLIVDEVQTGLGRTGHDLAIHQEGVEADLVCLAKSLAGGLPLGATIAHERLDPLGRGLHGTTFGGSPLACQAALAVLSILEDEQLAEQANHLGQRTQAAIQDADHPLVREMRGRGLMLGIELGARATPVLQAMQRDGVLALPGGDSVVRLLPPLVITEEEADRISEAVLDALDTVQASYQQQAEASS